MNNLHHLHKFSRAHALIAPAHAQELVSLAASPIRTADNTDAAMQHCAQTYGFAAEKGKPFLFAGGMAVIPVYGALLHRDPWCDSYATGYDYIASRFGAALGDPDVKGILFDVNSYGGHVAGNFELCDMIYAARGKKPMAALVDSRALSGGYSIASSVGRVIATPSGDLGSIGVVMMHMSIEKALKNFGVEVTFIFAGKHKVDGNPFEDLPDDVKAALQASVAKSYDQFVSLVARNRSLDPDAVRATEARVYDADEAKRLGLIDEVMPPREAFASFLTELSSSTQTKEVKKMSDTTASTAAGAGGEDTARQAAEQQAATEKAATEKAAAEARTAEKTRIAGIVNCEEAQKRPKLANHLAMSTEMSVDDARKVLAASAEEKAEQPAAPKKGPLAEAMDAGGGAEVGATDGAAGGEGGKTMSAAERITAAHRKATGYKPDAK